MTVLTMGMGQREPAKAGWHNAVLAEYTPTVFYGDGEQTPKGLYIFQLEELYGPDAGENLRGKRKEVRFYFPFSTGPNSKISRLMAEWRGRPFQPGEKFDLESPVGHPVKLELEHKVSRKGVPYASIVRALPPDTPMEVEDYMPVEERQRRAAQAVQRYDTVAAAARKWGSPEFDEEPVAPAAGGFLPSF